MILNPTDPETVECISLRTWYLVTAAVHDYQDSLVAACVKKEVVGSHTQRNRNKQKKQTVFKPPR